MARISLAFALLCALLVPAIAQAAFPDSPPNDPLYDANPLPNAVDEQWDLASPGGGFDRGISVDRAWPLSTGSGVTIADIDLGVQLDHPDLAGRWATNPGELGTDAQGRPRASNGVDDDHNGYIDDWRGWDFYSDDPDPSSDSRNPHGTNVAGVLGARADNGIGIAGVAPGASLLPLRTSDNILHQGVRLGEAITYAADRGAKAMSMSLGADSFPLVLRRAVAYAHRRGAVIAVASGNEFASHHHYPQVLDDVLAVGGINPDTAPIRTQDPDFPLATSFTNHASYADYGPHLDVVAPTQVPTTEWGGGYRKNWDGTSAATPHVAGVAALVIARGQALGLKLSADEVIQIIRQSADDLSDPALGYAPGWDPLSGWGRVNAFRAVSMAAPGTIPPVANLVSPSWYAAERGRLNVTAIIHGRSATRWTLELGKGEDPSSWQAIASGRGAGTKPARIARLNAAKLGQGGWTLRLSATDARGNHGEDRDFFTSVADPALLRGYPKRLGTSGEASPVLTDLNGDHAADIVLATSDGLLHVYSGRGGHELPGFPVHMHPAVHAGTVSRHLRMPVRAGFLATPAVGNIAGNRRREIVAAGLDGRLYAWTARGKRVHGFPFHIGLYRPAEEGQLDAAIYASPALADLDGDGKLDIVFGAADQRIYAINGHGRPLPGWPVLARSGGDPAKILSSPAIGDLNGDGQPDIVEGTAEAYGSTPNMTGRVYAFDRHGQPLPGWPISPTGLVTNAIPLAGEGVPDSPSLADVDGDGRDEVAVSAFTGTPGLYRGDGTPMPGPTGSNHFNSLLRGSASPASAPSELALGANSAFGRTSAGGPLRYFGGLIDERLALAQLSPASRVPFEHLMGGWDAVSGNWLDAFPQPIEGWQIPSAPAIADIGGDGQAEVIAGSSGNVLHAWRADGREPAGWPKRIGQWLLASPAVGDVDGDGKLEVVAVSREGYLYVWNTPSRGRLEWPAFRHDAHNSGRYPG